MSLLAEQKTFSSFSVQSLFMLKGKILGHFACLKFFLLSDIKPRGSEGLQMSVQSLCIINLITLQYSNRNRGKLRYLIALIARHDIVKSIMIVFHVMHIFISD